MQPLNCMREGCEYLSTAITLVLLIQSPKFYESYMYYVFKSNFVEAMIFHFSALGKLCAYTNGIR